MASAVQSAHVADAPVFPTSRVSISSTLPNPSPVPPTRSGSEAASATGGAGSAVVDHSNSHVGGGRGDGMRREWNFSLLFQHQAARLSLQCAPQWEPTFIGPESAAAGRPGRAGEEAAACTLVPVLRYTDLSVVVGGAGASAAANATNTSAATLGVGVSTSLGSSPSAHVAEMARTSGSIGGARVESEAGEWWVEKAKHVEAWYARVGSDVTLAQFCRTCVQHVLTDPMVVSVDGDSRLTRLTLGRKLACPSQLAGRYRSFHFRFRLHDRSQLMNDAAYAVGAIAGQRGYLFLVRCAEEEELEGYLRRLFLPYYTSPVKLTLDTDVVYGAVASGMLRDQQTLFGELVYTDRDGAVSFSLPMYPMRCKPDFSPAKTVGVGSIACMTLELGVFERVFEDATVAEATGMPKYKVNQVVLCLDVEDVVRMGYPNVLSTDQYSELKIKRLLEVFPDANLVSQQPTTVMLGGKAARSYTTTFSYEPMQCTAKAMLVTTLIDGYGVTALYLTRLSGGCFDAYLYLFEQLLGAVRYLPPSSQQASLRLSRHRAPNIRLLETDLSAAYAVDGGPTAARAAAAADPSLATGAAWGARAVAGPGPNHASTGSRNKVRERHARLMRQAASDGTVPEGSVVLQVPVELGGLPRQKRASAAAAPTAIAAAGRRSTHHRAGEESSDGPATAAPAGASVHRSLVGEGRVGVRGGSRRESAGSPEAALTADFFSASTTVDYYGNEDAAHGPWGPAAAPSPATSPQVSAAGGAAVAAATAGSGVGVLGAATPSGTGGATFLYGEAVVYRPGVDPDAEDALSLHSDSIISITGIPRLAELQEQAAMFAAESAEGLREGEEAGDGSAGAAGPRPTTAGWAAGERGFDSPYRSALAAAAAAAAAMSTASGSQVGSRRSSGASRGPADETASDVSSGHTPAAAPRPRASTGTQGSDSNPFGQAEGAGSSVGPFREPAEGALPDTGGPCSSGLQPTAAAVAAEAAEEARIHRILSGESHTGGRGGRRTVDAALEEGGATAPTYVVGPSLRDVYIRCCDLQRCRPNSYLLKKLPTDPRFTSSVEEIDLTSNYLGRNGFVAVLNLLEHLPQLKKVYFNAMALDSTDAEHMCEALSRHPTIAAVEVKNNPKITLPAARFFTRMLRANGNIRRLALEGTRIGESVIAKLEAEAARGHVATVVSQAVKATVVDGGDTGGVEGAVHGAEGA